jgi:hypothetical protein
MFSLHRSNALLLNNGILAQNKAQLHTAFFSMGTRAYEQRCRQA